jgi:hypothetical protein
MFNPIRPVDGGKQGDSDNDGEGDVCDPCPLSPGSTDCLGDPNDLDGDGVVNSDDNCPNAGNADQADGDSDGKGDACDPCPMDANPGAATCPGNAVSIYAIQDTSDPNHPSEGTRVRIGCIITAVSNNSVWCQEIAGGAYSGIAVYAAAAPGYVNETKPVQIGDNVTIDGDYAEFFDVSQLENPEITFVGTGAIPAPMTLSPTLLATGSASAEMYEGVLVRVVNVTVTNINPDAPADYDEFAVTSGLRVDDMIVDGGGTGGTLDNTYALGTPFSAIVGVHHYSFNDFKLLPRSAADLTP